MYKLWESNISKTNNWESPIFPVAFQTFDIRRARWFGSVPTAQNTELAEFSGEKKKGFKKKMSWKPTTDLWFGKNRPAQFSCEDEDET